MRRSCAAVLAAMCALLAYSGAERGAAAQADTPVIAAAADLKFALPEVAAEFKKQTGHELKLVFGSSGQFATQIENGAPFQLFLSADESYVRRLAAKGLTQGDGVLYAVGRIVLFTPNGTPLRPDPELKDLRAALSDGRVKRFAIANPEHAPYGRAAREALQRAGIWREIEPKLVLGENAVQAMQFAASGSSQGGIVPLSLALAPDAVKLGRAASIPDDWYAPLRQRMALLRSAGPVATAFHEYLQTPPAREILARYGFALPVKS